MDPAVQLIGGIVVLIGTAGGLWWRVTSLVAEEANKRERLEKSFNDYKLHIAEVTVTAPSLEKAETRLAGALEGVAARIETVIGRMEKVEVQLVRLETVTERAPLRRVTRQRATS